jgi:hypothetical protein
MRMTDSLQTDRISARLAAGFAAATIFIAVTAVEIFARPGFDLHRHAVSVLSLGPRGWLMIATFLVSGVLTIACAAGMRGATAGRPGGFFGPLLVGVYGVGLVVAGIFPAPAGLGFPPGTPDDMMPVMTTTAILHSVGFMLGFGSLIAACFVFARYHFAGRAAGRALLSLAVGVAIPVFIGLGMASIVPTGVGFYIAAVLAWIWLVLTAGWLIGGRHVVAAAIS